jgi:hypothetical protein
MNKLRWLLEDLASPITSRPSCSISYAASREAAAERPPAVSGA